MIGSQKHINQRKFERTGIKTYHRGRVPGTVRVTRLPGGPGNRNYWQTGDYLVYLGSRKGIAVILSVHIDALIAKI